MKTIFAEEGYPLALFQTYLAMILGSVGSHQYRQLFVCTVKGIRDVMRDGDLACAYFVSSILTLCGLIAEGVHTTIDETVRDMESYGWEKIPGPRVGSVVVWAKICDDGHFHRHIGFCIGDGGAVSIDVIFGVPVFQPLIERTDSGVPCRLVESYYFHPRLGMKDVIW